MTAYFWGEKLVLKSCSLQEYIKYLIKIYDFCLPSDRYFIVSVCCVNSHLPHNNSKDCLLAVNSFSSKKWNKNISKLLPLKRNISFLRCHDFSVEIRWLLNQISKAHQLQSQLFNVYIPTLALSSLKMACLSYMRFQSERLFKLS